MRATSQQARLAVQDHGCRKLQLHADPVQGGELCHGRRLRRRESVWPSSKAGEQKDLSLIPLKFSVLFKSFGL